MGKLAASAAAVTIVPAHVPGHEMPKRPTNMSIRLIGTAGPYESYPSENVLPPSIEADEFFSG